MKCRAVGEPELGGERGWGAWLRLAWWSLSWGSGWSVALSPENDDERSQSLRRPWCLVLIALSLSVHLEAAEDVVGILKDANLPEDTPH